MCEHCLYAKQAMNSHSTINKKWSELLELVHSDMCGPMPAASMGGASYFVTFIDDFSQKVWAYPLKCKDEVFQSSSILSHWLRQRLARKSNVCI